LSVEYQIPLTCCAGSATSVAPGLTHGAAEAALPGSFCYSTIGGNTMNKAKGVPFKMSEYLSTPEERALYIEEVMKDHDETLFLSG